MGPDTDKLRSLFNIIAIIVEGIFYGLFCVIFGLYLRIQINRRDGFRGLVTYALTLIFILCTASLAVDTSSLLKSLQSTQCFSNFTEPTLPASRDYLGDATSSLFIFIDLISQGILIYRCWILWRRPLIVVISVIASLVFLAIAMTSLFAFAGGTIISFSLIVTGFFISLTVNALITSLIVCKIIIELKASAIHGGGPRRDIYLTVSILVESGIITFIAQLVQVILYMVGNDTEYMVVAAINTMLYGISPTIVLVRVAMGLSYDTEALGISTSPHIIQFTGAQSGDDNQTVEMTTGNTLEDSLFELKNKHQTVQVVA